MSHPPNPMLSVVSLEEWKPDPRLIPAREYHRQEAEFLEREARLKRRPERPPPPPCRVWVEVRQIKLKPGPVAWASGVTFRDPGGVAWTCLRDLVAAAEDFSAGRRTWLTDVAEERLGMVRACGVTVRFRKEDAT